MIRIFRNGMTLKRVNVFAYLTFIVLRERTCDGCIDKHIANGTVLALLNRYLELEEEIV